jgi:phospholipase C
MTELARNYAVSDAWFASGPVQTLVNRIFAHSGQPSTYTDPTTGQLFNCIDNTTVTGQADDPLGVVNVKTVFDQLDEKFGSSQINWKVYYNDFPLSALIHNVYEKWGPFQENVCKYDSYLASDVSNGTLPRYSFIEPRYTNMSESTRCQGQDPAYQPSSYHPGGACPAWDPNGADTPPPVSVSFGEKFLAHIYKTLARHPQVFDKTLLIVTFDEHGGLFDHVPPPAAIPPIDGVANFDYSRYGVRVPAIFINPRIKPGTVLRSNQARPFDHTTIIATLREQFGLKGSLTHRDHHAPTLAGLINATERNPFSPDDLLEPDGQIPPDSERGIAVPDLEDPNSLYAIIHRGMTSARLKGKL